ncbi:DMT family protein [Niabella terrae]
MPIRTILLLVCSNVFMTLAWYFHLKHQGWPLWKAVLISWGIAFFEYCLTVPANRLGDKSGLSLFQLKMVQEVVTLVVFCSYAVFFTPNNPFHWKYLISFLLLLGAVYFAFADIK